MRPVEEIMPPTLDRSWSVSLVSTKYVVSFSGLAGGRISNVLEVHKTTHRSSSIWQIS